MCIRDRNTLLLTAAQAEATTLRARLTTTEWGVEALRVLDGGNPDRLAAMRAEATRHQEEITQMTAQLNSLRGQSGTLRVNIEKEEKRIRDLTDHYDYVLDAERHRGQGYPSPPENVRIDPAVMRSLRSAPGAPPPPPPEPSSSTVAYPPSAAARAEAAARGAASPHGVLEEGQVRVFLFCQSS